VFGTHICLDMLDETDSEALQMSAAAASNLYGGWSSAYSVQSILLQLQAFLMDGACRYMYVWGWVGLFGLVWLFGCVMWYADD
jgi:hypothetical protein